jgi:SAM-dependent methyltransferase
MTEISELANKTTVGVVEDVSHQNTTVYIVGEEHSGEGARRAGSLARELLRNIEEPEVVAIEDNSPSVKRGGAMGAVYSFAEENLASVFAIDEPKSSIREACSEVGCSYGSLLLDANEFSHPIQEDGDLDPRAIRDARERVKENYGERVYDAMYTHREKQMAGRLRYLAAHYKPIVAAVGAFHVPSITHRLEPGQEGEISVGSDRATTPAL